MLISSAHGGGSSGGGSPDGLLVAAHDSRDSVKAIADFICDGVDDQEQFMDAFNALPHSIEVPYANFKGLADGTANPAIQYGYDYNVNTYSAATWAIDAERMTNTGTSGNLNRYVALAVPSDPFIGRGDPFGSVSADITYGTSGGAGIATSVGRAIIARITSTGVQLVEATSTDSETVLATYATTITPSQTYNLKMTLTPSTTYAAFTDATASVEAKVYLDGVLRITFTVPASASYAHTWEYVTLFVRGSNGNHHWDNVRRSFLTDSGTVLVADGTYLFSDTAYLASTDWDQSGALLSILSNATLRGTGTAALIMPAADFPSGNALLYTGSSTDLATMDHVTIRNLGFLQPGGMGIDATAIKFKRYYADVGNCEFGGFSGAVLDCVEAGVNVIDNVFLNNAGENIRSSGGYDAVIANNEIQQPFVTPGSCIVLDGSGNYVITGNQIACRGHGIEISDSSLGNNSAHLISGNSIAYSEMAGIHIYAITGCHITGNLITENSGPGIEVYDSDGVSIHGNDITYNGFQGIRIGGCNGASIVGNFVAENGWDADDTYPQIEIGNSLAATPVPCTDVAVMSNTVRQFVSAIGQYYGSAPKYGLEIKAGSSGTYVFGNDLRDAGTVGNFQDAGTATDTTSTNRTT